MPVEIEDIDLGFDDFFNQVKELTSIEVEVGYTQSSGAGGGIGLADLAIIQEFGARIPVTKKMRGYLASQGLFLKASTQFIVIPPRPAIRDSFDNNVSEIADFGEELLVKFIDRKIDANTAYEVWGDFYNDIFKQGVITRSLELDENHPFTINQKGSETPLIDNGRLIGGSDVMVSKK